MKYKKLDRNREQVVVANSSRVCSNTLLKHLTGYWIW